MVMEPPLGSLEKGLGHNEGMDGQILKTTRESQEYERQRKLSHANSFIPRRRDRGPVPKRRHRADLPIYLVMVTFVLVYIGLRSTSQKPHPFHSKACSWLGLCDDWLSDGDNYMNDYLDVITQPEDLSNDPRILHEIPQYVLDYAPLVHLYSEEQFWPCDIAEHLFHVTPELNYTPIKGRLQYSNLTNLDDLNEFEKGRHVYLTSNDNVEERPDWLGGQKNIPDEFDEDPDLVNSRRRGSRPGPSIGSQSHGGRSDAPAVLVTVNKGHGIVDAFWFYFYSYNLGNIVFNIRFGNHVGDWEHSLIRFQHGEPKLVFYSEHYFGEAYNYSAVEKIGKRVSNDPFPSR